MTSLPLLAQLRALYDRAPSTLAPAGPMATSLARLGWVMTGVGTLVFLLVMTLLILPVWRRRNASGVDGAPAPVNETAWILYAGTAVPAIILAAVFVATLGAYRASAPPARMQLTIEVTGHQWWWEVRYPDQHVVTANEIHLPVGEPVRILLRSDDVIHSFWIPNLAGKTDAIPGVVNATWLEADSTGTWRGTCAEFCGVQHAHMALSVVAEKRGDFARWLASEASLSQAPGDSATLDGEHAFLGSQCVYCHTVRGTQASGKVGPDLTHIASRLTLASGTLTNTSGNLAGWIENPDRLKPGTKMPAVALDAARLEAIVTYLGSLK
jgi:cytochrome c oxidase subunit 2